MRIFVLKKEWLPPIHEEGIIFSVIFAVIALILWHIAIFLGIFGIVMTAWCLYFFRNPDRVTPTRPDLIISPADGVVQMITSMVPPKELEMGTKKLTRVSIFMNVFNVHVNRVPIDGILTSKHYHSGKFLNASLDKASEYNERQYFTVTGDNGLKVGFVQIAGLIARRIRCDVSVGDSLKAGQRFGLIRFGSRVDVFLPPDVVPLVIVGQKTIAGETVIADIKSTEGPRSGIVRP